MKTIGELYKETYKKGNIKQDKRARWENNTLRG